MKKCPACKQRIDFLSGTHEQCRRYVEMYGLKEAQQVIRVRQAAGLWP